MLKSAGLLAYRKGDSELEFFLVHPGGPFFAKKDEGFWTVPKGLVENEEDLWSTACREFEEETGQTAIGDFIDLGHIVQKGGKRVYCFAVSLDFDAAQLKSNSFEIEWPPRSGKMRTFPEVDRGDWFRYDTAKLKMNAQQVPFLDRLLAIV